jgi:hypothetical protein
MCSRESDSGPVFPLFLFSLWMVQCTLFLFH